MMVAAAISLIAVAAMAGGGEAAPPTLAESPIALFEAACLGGSASLPRGKAEMVDYRQLPQGARQALGTAGGVGLDWPSGYAPSPKQVPNRIYRIAAPEPFYLVTPSSAAGQPSDLAGERETCAVLWRGGDRDFERAVAVVLPPAPSKLQLAPESLPGNNPMGLALISTNVGNHVLTAAGYSGWLALRAAPKLPEKAGAS